MNSKMIRLAGYLTDQDTFSDTGPERYSRIVQNHNACIFLQSANHFSAWENRMTHLDTDVILDLIEGHIPPAARPRLKGLRFGGNRIRSNGSRQGPGILPKCC